ncbi:DUF4175 family protein [Seonamhaeicola marinus]|uniref:DUF4175 family protein n=1 Tax=Seonamhaeicola marinus TaxID=1912246 RepID=A0A5D0HSZ1_9FLAO|nr:DUF4175 family protein [Seonamhaeicola marinus]TYA74171.1 hypothetical protein FUA24_12595 [Seonamhaeicola marinus]
MQSFKAIQGKLEAFIRRYYINELLKGSILFFAIGLLYFLFTLFIEYVLWLGTGSRTILFWLFVVVELFLLGKFIVLPIAKLLKLKQGINYLDASRIIGNHFPEVKDKLLNILQLNSSDEQSELLLASIEQKSVELKPIPFRLAVNFKENVKYLKYAAIPILILLVTFLTDNLNWFSKSYDRVVHYKTFYEQPAPFQFLVVNEVLQTVENKDYKLLVKTTGDVYPENVQVKYDGETYFLKQTELGGFEYDFIQPKSSLEFQLVANEVTSKFYNLEVIKAPSILNFEMVLDYPGYTNKRDEVLKGTGNTIVPEGTKVTWNLNTNATDYVNLFAKDTVRFDKHENGRYTTFKNVKNALDYKISTNNKDLTNYENLSFRIDVVKDRYPEIDVEVKVDSLDNQTLYFFGQANDDYGFSKLQLVYYPVEDEANKSIKEITFNNSNVTEFLSAFPDDINVLEGVAYNLYFQVRDNDYLNGYKSAKSKVFSYRKRTKAEEERKQLNDQSNTINQLNKSLDKFKSQEKTLKEITQTQKEKPNLNFNDKKKFESFLRRQQEQDEMMKNFNKKLKDNLKEFQKDREDDAFKKDLQKRLEENEKQLTKDEKLLKELEKIQDKINKEQLVKKLEELAKQNKNKKRSLQQLLELTKRYYVEKKLEKLKDDLQKMASDQEKLSNEEEENTSEKQDELNKAFEDFKNDLEELKKENKDLKKPFEIPQDKLEENEIQKEQNKASEELKNSERETLPEGAPEDAKEKQKQHKKSAQKSQKNAAKKMKQMSQQMQSSMQSNSGEQMQEDMDMLRQILDNLVLFSFDEEALMNSFKSIDVNHSKFASHLRKQHNLKEHFEHIDDSLFALSLRQPKLSEKVNKEITEVYFNIDKAIDLLAENQLYQGVANQQFAVTATNNLADFLSDILDNMQENMNMSAGKGKGDEQLPDIIMSQEQLNQMMKDAANKSKQKGKKKEGESEGESKEGNKKDGTDGEKKPGEKGSEGEGESDQFNEDLNGELFEIYQRQQELRESLQKEIEKQGLGSKGNRLIKQMEDVELDLLNKGFTNQTLQKMLNLKHELMKLENAVLEQGKDDKRESKTNKDTYNSNSKNAIPKAKEYFKTIEILDKQAVPLRGIYKKKVQEYFNKTND